MKQQKPLIVANWKMHMTVVKAVSFVQRFRDLVQHPHATIVLCAPFTALSALRYELQKGQGSLLPLGNVQLFLSAQHMFSQEEGAFTGEISPAMVKELASFVLLGHSERRHLFHETDAEVHKKILAAHAVELVPILCVGAFVGEKEGQVSHFVEKKLDEQLRNCLTGLSFSNGEKLVLAYEPLGAIGTGHAEDPQRIGHILYFIRRFLEQQFGAAVAQSVSLLYGGSVTSANAKQFLQEKEIDGLLVGSASLDVEEFVRIVQCV